MLRKKTLFQDANKSGFSIAFKTHKFIIFLRTYGFVCIQTDTKLQRCMISGPACLLQHIKLKWVSISRLTVSVQCSQL